MNMDIISANKVIGLAMLLTSFIAGSDSAVIKGALHRDVLLPCHVTYTGAFMMNELVINWQRSENYDVVHSFFYKTDKPQYQKKEYEGRTQLFPEEFHKGNASLLLKDVRASDAGNYTCHYFLHDKEGFTAQPVELLVQDLEMDSLGAMNTSRLYLLSLAPVILVIAAVILIVLRRHKRPKQEDEEELLTNTSVYGAIDNYRREVQNTGTIFWKSLTAGEEQDGCLHRTLHTISGKNKEKEPGGTEYMLEKKESMIDSEDLFTAKTKELISRRMLIAGDAGIGKSWLCMGLQKQWAFGKTELFYKCVIYITFNELNAIKRSISLRELLESKCTELSKVLTELLNERKVLIILDGLDEFNHNLKDSQPSKSCDIDTPLDISTLISKIISKQLLPNTDVLVTSRLSSVHKIRESFSSAFIMEEFTEKQIREYCQKCMSGDEISKSICEFITTHKLSSLVSIPLLSSVLCEIYKKGGYPQNEVGLTTCSRLMFSLLRISLRDTLEQTGDLDQVGNMRLMAEESKLPENIKNTVHQLCEISYNNLISGVQEIESKGIDVDAHTENLLKNFSEFFFIKDRSEDKLVYRHASIRDMFAALHWVGKIQDETVLKKQLDEWAFDNNWKRFQSFLRFFIALFPYGDNSFLSEQLPSETKKDFLKKWFQGWIAKRPEKMYLLHLLHCAFELHIDDVTEEISRHIKNIRLFNTPLNSLDIRALLYCYQSSTMDLVDLRLCELDDHGLEQIQSIIRNCTEVWLSSNKLTEKSGEVLKDILEHNECAIEKLSLGTNRLGSDGTKHLFKGLEKNKSLTTLSLKDNNIDDSGIEHMAQSLKYNKTLQKLHLCMNLFGVAGMKKIKELQQCPTNLKIVIRIAEDEEVLQYAEEKVKSVLSEGWDQYETKWLVDLVENVLKDLEDDEHIHESVNDRVNKLKQNIKMLLQKIETEKGQAPDPKV